MIYGTWRVVSYNSMPLVKTEMEVCCFICVSGRISKKLPLMPISHFASRGSLFDLAKYRFWSGEAIPGVRRPVFIRVRTAYSIAAT